MNLYGLSEMCGPGVAAECPTARRAHVQEDHFLVEVIDPDSGEACPGRGRARVHDAAQGGAAPPALPHRRPRRAHARALRLRAHAGPPDEPARAPDDMVIVRGVNLFPSHVEHVLLERGGRGAPLPLLVERNGPMDELTVHASRRTAAWIGPR